MRDTDDAPLALAPAHRDASAAASNVDVSAALNPPGAGKMSSADTCEKMAIAASDSTMSTRTTRVDEEVPPALPLDPGFGPEGRIGFGGTVRIIKIQGRLWGGRG